MRNISTNLRSKQVNTLTTSEWTCILWSNTKFIWRSRRMAVARSPSLWLILRRWKRQRTSIVLISWTLPPLRARITGRLPATWRLRQEQMIRGRIIPPLRNQITYLRFQTRLELLLGFLLGLVWRVTQNLTSVAARAPCCRRIRSRK